MKKISIYFLMVALLWFCSMALANKPTVSGKPHQKAATENSVEKPIAQSTHNAIAIPEAARPQPKIDPALTSTNAGGPNPAVKMVERNISRSPTATSPKYSEFKAEKLRKETAGKSWGIAVPPDPNVILQGGDNIAAATVIPSIPFSAIGTTAGYQNDYDAACPGTSAAPDVVYSFTPQSNMTATISLCGNTAYDSKLYVFENTVNNVVGCSDDVCSTPSLPNPWVSRIDGLNLIGGNTYYIIVDGYGNNAGAYTLDITLPTDCTPDFNVTGPGIWNGNTCGAGDDSPLRNSEDQVYEVTLPIAGNWTFSLCGSSESWDSYIYVGTTPCSEDLGQNDDYCPPLSQVTVPIPEPGTYYVTIEGFFANSCGAYELNVMAPLDPPANDSCSAAIPVTTYPSTICGTVAGATIDCPDNLGWPAVWYSFDAPYTFNNISIDYCGTDGMIYEVGISLFQNCDDCNFAPADEYSWNQCDNGYLNPSMNWYNLPGPATYYFAAHTIGVSNFCFDVNVFEAVQCEVTCPAGGMAEGEPDCGDEYVDNTNGGCNSFPSLFQPYTFGTYMCGKSGTFLFEGMQYRDTDWYSVTLTEMGTITWNVVAEFAVQTFIYFDPYNDCNTTELAYGSTWTNCDTISITTFAAQPGTYYFWVGPQTFSGVACGRDYVAWGTLGPPPPCVPDNIISVPGTTNGTTCGIGNDWNNTCLGEYDRGEDVLYQFTLDSPMTVDIALDPLGSYSTGFALATDCYMQNCITQHTAWWGTPHGVTVLPLDAGTYYIMVDSWPMGEDCIPSFNLTITQSAPPPANDNCSSVTPVPLSAGVPVQFIGDNTDATRDCQQLDYPEVWHAVTTTECMDLTVDLCGTNPAFGNSYLVITDGCPCGSIINAIDFNNYTCSDGNVTQIYYNLPPGTYYIPVLSEIGTMGPYTLNVLGTICPPPPPADFMVTAPGTWTGNTCGALNDCHLLPSEEQIYEVVIPNDGTWKFSLCNTYVWWNSILMLGSTSCTSDIASDDNYCFPLSEITADITAGTYFLTVEGYGSSCGEYTLDILEIVPPPDPCDNSLYTNHSQPMAAAMATQCDPVYPFQAGCADDFVLSANATINRVVAWIAFWDGPLDPSNVTGINVIFYANNNGVPGGRPLGTDPSCGYQADISGGLISVQQSTSYTTIIEPSGLYQFSIDIAPVALAAGTTYWIEISPIMNSSIGGQTGWAPSDMMTGNSGMQIFLELEIPEWSLPMGVPTDFAFCLHGTEGGPSQCAYTPGDINGNGTANGIDVVFGVNYFKGIGVPPVDCNPFCPTTPAPFYAAGDVNGNCTFNGIDITFFVRFLKGQVSVLLYCVDCPPAPNAAPAVIQKAAKTINQQ